MGNFIKRMGQTKGFKTVMFAVKVFAENFIETGSDKTPSKIDNWSDKYISIQKLHRWVFG